MNNWLIRMAAALAVALLAIPSEARADFVVEFDFGGGKIILDGRNIKVPESYPYGNFVGPTIILGNTSMRSYQ